MKTIIFVWSFFFYYLLNELNAGLQVETEIDEDPLDTFTGVLFLLEDEHVVIEELLQLLVDKVNPQLLEGVELKNIILEVPDFSSIYVEDLESGNIEHTNEVITVNSLLIEGQVAFGDEPVEHTSVHTFGHRTDCPVDLFHVLSLGHPLGTDLKWSVIKICDFLDFIIP